MSTTNSAAGSAAAGDHWDTAEAGGVTHALKALYAFSAGKDSLRLAQRLSQVCDIQDDSGTLAPVLRLACASDSVQTLEDWAEADPDLKQWARFARGLWHSPDLLSRFPAVRYGIAPEDLYRKDLTTLYLPAACAIPTPEGVDVEFSGWHRRLRLWLVIKAVRAAEAGFIFEPALRELCKEVRLTGRRGDTARLTFLRRVQPETDSASLSRFEQTLVAACMRHKGDGGDGRTIANLTSRVASEAWRADPETQDRPARSLVLAPLPSEPDAQSSARSPVDNPAAGELTADVLDGNPLGGEVIDVDQDAPPPGQELEATGLHLLNRAAGHMLPWDWHVLISAERYELVDWIESMLEPTQAQKSRTGAALVAVAILTSRSARGVLRVQLGQESGEDWKLDLNSSPAKLHRMPSRPERGEEHTRLLVDPSSKEWLRPLAEAWVITLAPQIALSLTEATPIGSQSLSGIWLAVANGETLEHWFNTQLRDHPTLYRLTSPILAGALRTCAYQASGDHVLARLATASSQSVLPASCGYASYTGKTVRNAGGTAFARLGTWVGTSIDEANAAGSRLDVDDLRLRTALSALAQAITVAADRTDWARHHNLLTAYVTVCVLASTGVRPHGTPIESYSCLDLERGLIFVDDKGVERGGGARICVLARPVCELLQYVYVPHLRRLADSMPPRLGDFAAALRETIQGVSEPSVPLFFFVRCDDEFDWQEVTESSLDAVCGEAWPLPWNFLRHRLSTRLRRYGLHAEVIDALMGHGEEGSETHGAHSLRVLADDLELARPLIESLTQELGIVAPAPCAPAELSPQVRPARPLVQPQRVFGARRRRAERDERHERARAQARTDIETSLQHINKPPEALASEEWDQIARSMLLRSDNLRHPFASLRYEVFEEYLSRLWSEHGIKPRLKKRYRIGQAGESLITEAALMAPQVRTKLADVLDAIADTMPASGKPQLCRALAAAEMSINCGVADLTVLNRIAQSGHVKPVKHLGRWYIEVFEGDGWVDGLPLRRFEVTARSVRWLVTGQIEKRSNAKPLPLPVAMRPLASVLGLSSTTTTRQLLAAVAACVDQSNLLRRSGFEAAVLAGRVQISALPHSDLVRAAESKAFDAGAISPELEDSSEEGESIDLDKAPSDPAQQTSEGCRAFLQLIRKVLSSEPSRDDAAREIRKLCAASPFGEGDLPNALARWSAKLLQREIKGGEALLDRQTVLRYFDALSPKVSAVGFSIHLADLDDDELTDIYFNLVRVRVRTFAPGYEPSSAKSAGQAKPDSPAAGDTATTHQRSVDLTGDQYAVPILREFHEYAADRFGLDEPDWSLIGDVEARPAGRPGILTDAEYEATLTRLIGSAANRQSEMAALEQAWVLLLCYRFGARGGEAVGLHRSDWQDLYGSVVLLIRPNGTRGLKTLQSKRPIPLIDALSAVEQSIVSEVLRRFDERRGPSSDAPLIPGFNAKRYKYRRIQITSRLLRLLKQITLNRRATLHHARHSFCCRVFVRLSGRSLIGGELGTPASEAQYSTRVLLLGHAGIDRRSLWALARCMGHNSPAQLLKAYAHPLICGLDGGAQPGDSDFTHAAIIDLDAIPRSDQYLRAEPCNATDTLAADPAPTLGMLLNYLRVRATGRSAARAAWVVGVSPELGQQLESWLGVAACRQEVLHKGKAAMSSALQLVGRLRDKGLRALMALSERLQPDIRRPTIDLGTFEMTLGHAGSCVMSLPEHIGLVSDFVTDLRLTRADVHVALSPSAEALRKALVSSALSGLTLSEDEQARRKLQVDTAVMAAPEGFGKQEFKQRAALQIAGEGTPLISRYGLMLIWVSYAVLRSWPETRDDLRYQL